MEPISEYLCGRCNVAVLHSYAHSNMNSATIVVKLKVIILNPKMTTYSGWFLLHSDFIMHDKYVLNYVTWIRIHDMCTGIRGFHKL